MGAHADVVQSNSLKRGDRIAGRYGIQPSTEAWMNVMHRPAVLLCREIAGCALQTGNELVDQAVRKVAPFSNCVNTEQTHIIADDGKRPPPPPRDADSAPIRNVGSATSGTKRRHSMANNRK